MAWSVPVLDNDILGLKKRLDALRWDKEKKERKVEEQMKELETMKKVYNAATAEIHKDPVWKKVGRAGVELFSTHFAVSSKHLRLVLSPDQRNDQ